MFVFKRRPEWRLADRLATPEHVYLNRRTFITASVISGLSALSKVPLAASMVLSADEAPKRNPRFTLDRPITPEIVSTRYNNFREFSDQKEAVWLVADKFPTEPWTLKVSGLVVKEQVLDLDQLIRRMPLEERLYRHRCIEGWAMAVPWTGFPLKSLIDLVQPSSDARYVVLTSFYRPEAAEGQRLHSNYKWPMRAGLTMAEATNELAFLATGMYGHTLPKSSGAPIRLTVPWKYGFKSIKSIVKITFVKDQPPTTWNREASNEYGFYSNVNPNVDHPRWSQATERRLGEFFRRKTLMFNGYDEVASLYTGMDLKKYF